MKKLMLLLLLAVGGGAALYAAGLVPPDLVEEVKSAVLPAEAPPKKEEPAPSAPLVTVAKVEPATFVETVLVTGTLVPREEILVAPEVDGLRVLDLKVDEGDRVKKGDILATLVQETLDAKLAENDAAIAKANAAIAQAKSTIVQGEARLAEAKAAFERAEPLRKSGHIADSVFDQREAASRTADALLVAARDGLKVAEAEKAQVEAQRREIVFRLGNTEVSAPADGLVSRRTARVGSMASLAGEPMFRIIRNGEIELDAEVPETELAKIEPGDTSRIEMAGLSEILGKVRLVSPEVDRATRLGRVRVSLGDNPDLHIGAFGRGRIETRTSRGLAVPAAAVMYGPGGAYVQVVTDGKVAKRPVTVGLRMADLAEIPDGLTDGDLVVAKAGTFLRDGDAVRPLLPDAKMPGAKVNVVKS